MLNCLRGDSIMLVPLVKNGNPVVSGLSYHDPSMIWKEFKGNLARYIDDYVDGTEDLLTLWQVYGSKIWQRLPTLGQATSGNVDLRGG